MLLVASYNFASTVVIDISGAEQRFGIFWSKRLEALQVIEELSAYVLEVQHVIDFQDGISLAGQYVFVYVFFKPALELWNMLDFQGKTGSIGVSAEILKYVAAAFDSFVDIEPSNGTRRTGSKSTVASQDNGRPEVYFGQSRCNYADNAFVPLFIVDDNAFLIGLVHERCDNLVSLLCHDLVKILSLLVVMVNLGCLLLCFSRFFTDEQFNRLASVLYSSRSI